MLILCPPAVYLINLYKISFFVIIASFRKHEKPDWRASVEFPSERLACFFMVNLKETSRGLPAEMTWPGLL